MLRNGTTKHKLKTLGAIVFHEQTVANGPGTLKPRHLVQSIAHRASEVMQEPSFGGRCQAGFLAFAQR